MSHLHGFLIFGLVLSALGANVGRDVTMIPGTSGARVVTMVTERIRTMCTHPGGELPDDKLFTRRVAYVETRDGTNKNTYRPRYHGGIWMVDEAMFFKISKSDVLVAKQLMAIKSLFGIDWARLRWRACRKPLVSGLAASLFMYIQTQEATGNTNYPRDIPGQAAFWQKYYRKSGNTDDFIKDAKEIDKDCDAPVDLAIMLDGSGSVVDHFTKIKQFAADLVDSFDVNENKTRVSVSKYSTYNETIFYLENKCMNDKAAMMKEIMAIPYTGGTTRTHRVLDHAVQTVFTAPRGARNALHVPRVGILLTDGRSTEPNETVRAAHAVHDGGITMFAVGAGNYDEIELNTIATPPECMHSFHIDFDEVESLSYALKASACQAPVEIPIEGENGTQVDGTLPADGDKNCRIKLPAGGATIKIHVKHGTASFYTAHDVYPSAIYYTQKVKARPGYPGVMFMKSEDGDQILCNIKGDPEIDTDISAGIEPGDKDQCKRHPCKNGGTCVDEGNDYRCECPEGTTGDNCKEITDHCRSGPCKNRGTCVSEGSCYRCECPDGTSGNDCGEIEDECDPNPCENGICETVLTGSRYICHCHAGFSGENCDECGDTGNDCGPNNPCPERTAGRNYFAYRDARYFIQCDNGCNVLPCPPGTFWKDQVLTCIKP